ncbi:AAA family ATPase [Clostridium gasigenes]|nr:AAA family ATPase [Clostridium gasigenes]
MWDSGVFWLGFDRNIDLTNEIKNSIDIEKYIDTNCEHKEAIKIFSKIKSGDYILNKAVFQDNDDNIIVNNYVGIIEEDFNIGYKLDANLGHTLPVKWISKDSMHLNEYVYTENFHKIEGEDIEGKLKEIGLEDNEDIIDELKSSTDDKFCLSNFFYKDINDSIKNNELIISIGSENMEVLKNIKKGSYILFINEENIEGNPDFNSIKVSGVCKVKEDLNVECIFNNNKNYKFSVDYVVEEKRIKEKFSSIVNFRTDNSNRKISKSIFNKCLNIILSGPPGTGKTYNVSRESIKIFNYLLYMEKCNNSIEYTKYAIGKMSENKKIKFCTFHQSYGYEDFIEGLKSDGSGNFKPEDGIFKEIAIEALYGGLKFYKKVHIEVNKDNLEEVEINKLKKELVLENIYDSDSFDFDNAANYIMVIDEINRGNISKIFGELITLLEEDKRLTKDNQMIVKLPYSKEDFSLPPNLYIVGTMNTSDKSIALMDVALRRRFEFKEMMPQSSLLTTVDNVDLEKMLETMNKRIEFLYDRDYMIGHAYFINVKNIEEISRTFKNKIIPLLQEYFYDDWEKIGLILGGIGKDTKDSYIVYKQEIRASDLFKDNNISNKYGSKIKYYIKDDISIEELRNIYE